MFLLRITRPIVRYNKKRSYRRETARQLPTWRGLGPQPTLPTPPLATPMHMVESETRNKLTSSVPSTKRTLRWIGHSRSFKVILIGASSNPERCAVVMCNSCRHYFGSLRRYGNGKTANSSISTTTYKTSQQETPSNIYKWFILPETRVIDLYFCRW